MMGKTVRSREGKTLKVEIESTENKISKIVISGDFMAFPPKVIEELESSLQGRMMEEVEDTVMKVLRGAQLLGITPEEIVGTIKEILSSHRHAHQRTSR